MARARGTTRRDERAELAQIEDWYRHQLAQPVELPSYRWEPVRIGPTWRTEQVNGQIHWVLPEHTLGWECLAWCGRYLQESRGVPWQFTLEQARFLLHWYSIAPDGRWTYRDFVFQRLKGHGKDPLGACLCLFELVGNCRVADLEGDRVIGQDNPEAWVQVAATALEQTKTTMRLLPSMLTEECRTRYGITPAKEQVYALGSTRLFQAVTSAPRTLEGARASLALRNETHWWLETNEGHAMNEVIERNATKSRGGLNRTGSITNAYETGLDSVAEQARDAYDAMAIEGRASAQGLLYDSLEAAEDAPLTEDAAPEVIASVRGDSDWLDIPTITQSILDVRNPPSQSRRWWYNQIRAAEDAWLTSSEWAACARSGQLVLPDEKIVAFFDGSKTEDTTGLVGCRLSDGLLFRIAHWAKPSGDQGKGWQVDRTDVDAAVTAMFESYKVIAFFGDPSHALDDEGDERFWDALFDDWHRRYGAKLKTWAVKNVESPHAVMWDMSSHTRAAQFTGAAMAFVADVQTGELLHDGDRVLRSHVLNARRRPNKWGYSIGKTNRDSPRKIDLAVCAVGARMVRRLVLNKDAGKRQRSGKVW